MTDDVQVFEQQGQLWTTSLEVAARFGRRHDTVLRAIARTRNDCSPDFNARNFADVTYLDAKGEQRPLVALSREGFSMVAMGFTGRDAVAWKERFLAAFGAMEHRILELSRAAERRASREWQQARQGGKEMRRTVAEAIAAFVAYAKAQGSAHADRYFISITRMACRALFEFEPGQERLLLPSVRDFLDASQLTALAAVEDALGKALHDGIGEGWPYRAVYSEARKRACEVAAVLGKSQVRASAPALARATSGKRSGSRAAVQLSLWESLSGRT